MNAIRKKINALRIANPALLANTAMLLTMLAWGTSFISTKLAVAEIPPITLAFIRFAITSVLFYIISKRQADAAKITQLSKRDAGKIAMAGFIGIAVYFCFENTAIRMTTASNASLITSVTPIFSIALNMLFFRARLSQLECIGVLIGIVGAYLTVTANGNLDFSSATFQGNLLMLGAMTAWAFYTVLSKHLQRKYSGIFLLTWQTIFASAVLALLSLSEYSQWQFFSFSSLMQVLYLAFICSGLGYFLYIYALKILDVAVTTLYLNLIPIVGVASGYLVLGERILPSQILGGAIILGAIGIANLDKTRKLFRR